ncbi:unnamed protein product, partial [marine sediment metagenome]
AYPLERRFFRKYLSLDKGLLAYFKKKSIKLKKIEEEFNKTPKVERKSYLSQRLLQEEKRLSREWEPIALSFEKSENLKAIIIGYRGTYQNSFAFSNYIINGTVPDPLSILRGCLFAPRCLEIKKICQSEEEPPVIELEKGHQVKCWLYA